MTRLAIARAISIVGHPAVLLLVAALIAATTQGSSLRQLWLVGGVTVILGSIVLVFSWMQVRAGRWSHVDASALGERTSLNVFAGTLCLVSAALAWHLTQRTQMSIALALSGAIFVFALAVARWVKVSLHVVFAVFATALLWPDRLAVIVGVLVTAALMWSRVVLGRHVAADVAIGLALGMAAGVAYLAWVA
jgi:membrane-associated phospholipid phosphatase